MINSESEFWIDGQGREWYVEDLKDDHLRNIYNMLQRRKEKNMQFVNIRNEMRKRKFIE